MLTLKVVGVWTFVVILVVVAWAFITNDWSK